MGVQVECGVIIDTISYHSFNDKPGLYSNSNPSDSFMKLLFHFIGKPFYRLCDLPRAV